MSFEKVKENDKMKKNDKRKQNTRKNRTSKQKRNTKQEKDFGRCISRSKKIYDKHHSLGIPLGGLQFESC